MTVDWSQRRLGELLRLEYGKSLPERERNPGPIPVFGSAGRVGSHDRPYVQEPGIVIGRKGSIGTVTWVSEPFYPIDTTYYVASAGDEALDLRWAYHLLSHEDLRRLNRATGVPGLNRDDVHALIRPVPPLEEQRAIAAVLDSIDEAIERTDAVLASVHHSLPALLHRFDRMAAAKSPTCRPLGDLLSAVIDHRGRTPRKLGGTFAPEGIPVISADSLSSGRVCLTEQTRFVTPGLYRRWMPRPLRKGDVLLTSEAPLGGVAYLDTNDDYCLGQRLFALRADPARLDSRFLYFLLRSPLVQRHLARRATGTTAKGIRQRELLQVEVPVVPRPEQKRYARLLTAIESRSAAEGLVRHLLTELRSSTADALLSGRVRRPIVTECVP